ncbi:MAG TPA: Hsp20 family protein [Patescibacteria group bacterium]
MAIVRWTPMSSMLNRWPSIWEDDDFAGLSSMSGNNNLDVYETEDEVVVKANVAGIPADKVDITFEKGVLWISADKQEETEDKNKKHYSKSSWSYSYKVAVPGMIDFNTEPDAEVDEGVVTVTFKKAEASKPRKLQVKAKAKAV